jgi:hypothetical protein
VSSFSHLSRSADLHGTLFKCYVTRTESQTRRFQVVVEIFACYCVETAETIKQPQNEISFSPLRISEFVNSLSVF